MRLILRLTLTVLFVVALAFSWPPAAGPSAMVASGPSQVGITSAVSSGPGPGRWLLLDWYSYSTGSLSFYPTESGPLAGWVRPEFDDSAWDDYTLAVWDYWWGASFAQPSLSGLGEGAMVGRQGFVNRATYLYRRYFDIPPVPAGYELRTVELEAWSDNNAVFYINGQFVLVSGFPSGASQPMTARQLGLRSQQNVLAIQLANDDQSYNPIGIQFRLIFNYENTAPPTPTPTETGRPTLTPTQTATATATATYNPPPTATPTETLPLSPTATASASPSTAPSPTETATVSPSATATATSSPTATVVPSATASATATVTPSVTASATATATMTATPTATATPLPLLGIEIHDWHDPLVAGWRQRYTIVVSNAGALPALDVSIVDTIPALTSPLLDQSSPGASYDGRGLVAWDIGTLAPGASRTLYLELMTSSVLAHCSYITNRLEARSQGVGIARARSDTLMIRSGEPDCQAVIFP